METICKNYSNAYHNFYYEKNGLDSEVYIPDGFYYAFIDCYFNDWNLAKRIDNKCLYDSLFKEYNTPKNISKKINNIWCYDGEAISFYKILIQLESFDEVVCKKAVDSTGGYGVSFFSKIDYSKIDYLGEDLVIQEVIRQSKELDLLCNTSINTIRILTFLYEERIRILSSIVRFGMNGSRLDNGSSGGGFVGICESGQLNERGFSKDGQSYEVNPYSGISFNKIVISNFKQIYDDAITLHKRYPIFGLISWDYTLNLNEIAVLIEANFSYDGITLHQLNNVPIIKDKKKFVLFWIQLEISLKISLLYGDIICQ